METAFIAAYGGYFGQAAYAASKAGVAGMTLPVARAGPLRHTLRHHRAGHLRHADDGRRRRKRSRIAEVLPCLSPPAWPAGGVRRAGRAYCREHHAQWRGHSPGRPLRMAPR